MTAHVIDQDAWYCKQCRQSRRPCLYALAWQHVQWYCSRNNGGDLVTGLLIIRALTVGLTAMLLKYLSTPCLKKTWCQIFAITSERIRDVFTTRCYTHPHLPYLYLY